MGKLMRSFVGSSRFHRHSWSVVALMACSVVLVVLVGCASTKSGYKRADNIGGTAAKLFQDATNAQAAIERSVDSISVLAERRIEDPKADLRSYTSAVDQALVSWARVGRQADELSAASQRYFSKWGDEISAIGNSRMRDAANERREELMDYELEFRQQYEKTAQLVTPYLSKLENLGRMLQSDFTSEGVLVAREFIVEAEEEAIPVQESLAELMTEARQVAAEFDTAS